MPHSQVSEAASESPSSGSWVIEFSAPVIVVIDARCHQHLPIRQKSRCVLEAPDIEAAGDPPMSGGGVIKLRACDKRVAAGGEHLSIRQQRRGMFEATHMKAPGNGPGSNGWIV